MQIQISKKYLPRPGSIPPNFIETSFLTFAPLGYPQSKNAVNGLLATANSDPIASLASHAILPLSTASLNALAI